MNSSGKGRLTAFLETAPSAIFVGYAVAVSFSTYFCMYGFRKPFAAATFEGEAFFGSFLELKSAIVISQIMGYAISKYIGIRVCSELPSRYRASVLALLIGVAMAALGVYGAVPANWKVAAIFLNGLPLGMVWGLVVRYLEGRRSSELLLAGLSCSFIVSSGIVKDIGRAMMSGAVADGWSSVPLVGAAISRSLGPVSEGWMPFVTGLHILPLFLISVWLLDQLPNQSAADAAARTRRQPMDAKSRAAFATHYLPGIVLLVVAYFFLTAYRDFRDNYAVEIFAGLGYAYEGNETLITRAETIVALAVMLLLALLNTIRSNRLGVLAALLGMASGTLLLAISTLLLQAGAISGFWWMTLVGLGSYLAYVPYGSILFDRLMASTGTVGTAVFAIYLADAIGYTGSVGMLFYKDFAASELSRLDFFVNATWLMAAVGTIFLLCSAWYFSRNQAEDADRPLEAH
jgi:hypothetical protein